MSQSTTRHSVSEKAIAVLAAMAVALLLAGSFASPAFAADKAGGVTAVPMRNGIQVFPAASFAPAFAQASGNRSISVPGYLNVQGSAFDTYSQRDGYSLAANSSNKSVKLIRFSMDANGSINQVGELTYGYKNIGHANDATVYKKDGKEFLFVAIGGTNERTVKTYNGKKTKIAVIDLADYNQGIAKVYGCAVKAEKKVKLSRPLSKASFAGISYVGTKKVNKKKRDVFVIKDATTLYAAYATYAKNAFTLTIYDRGKIQKPVATYKGKKYDTASQGVTYHNGYLYLPFSGETNKAIHTYSAIGRIKYSQLFKGKTKLQTWSKRITQYEGVALSRHMPESVFFRTLNGKDNMYISVNRATTAAKAPDIDAVLRSSQMY